MLYTGEQRGFFQNIESMQVEATSKIELQNIRDEEGKLLRDEGRSRTKWVGCFYSLLNAKSDRLDPNILKRLPQ